VPSKDDIPAACGEVVKTLGNAGGSGASFDLLNNHLTALLDALLTIRGGTNDGIPGGT
jgi:hypothetical protein